MLRHHLKLALRSLRKNRTFSVINLLGLAFGLAAAVAVLLFVQDELSYDEFHLNGPRIVRVHSGAVYGDKEVLLGTAPNAAASFLRERLPEVEAATRVYANNFTGAANVRADDRNFAETRLYWADPNVFRVFSFDLLPGAAAEPLARPNTAVVSASTARRFFGEEAAVGRTIRVDNSLDLEITGVFADFPANTHLPLAIVGSFQSVPFGKPEHLSWGNASFYTYLLLQPGEHDLRTLETRIAALVKADTPNDRFPFTYTLKPLRQLHLYSGDLSTSDQQPAGDIGQVRILIGLAALLLLIACINYMNLATAQSQRRAREVTLSKTLGASSRHLALKFYAETALLTLLGIGGSILLLRLGLPFFNELSGKNLEAGFLARPWFWAGIAAIWLAVTLVAGAYPAAYLSSFAPATVLRQTVAAGRGGSGRFRQGLVVFQFCISTILIIATLIFHRQLNFIRDQKLGYAAEQVVALKVAGAENRQQAEALEQEIRSLSAVRAAARSQTFPGRRGSGRSLAHPGAEEGADLTTCRARPDVFEVLAIPFLAGRPMRVPTEGDTITEVVLNRAAAAYLGWTPEQAIGRTVEASLPNPVITGVVEDFHFGTLHEKIGSYAFHNARTEGLDFLLVKLEAGRLTDAMAEVEAAFRRTMPNTAFDYVFLDEQIDALYRGEQRMARVALVFAGLAIFIACLGLFALAAFAAERRTKEIGIRKVLGASVAGLTGLLARDFLKLVLLAIVIASPIAWYLMHRWLSDFAYRIDLSWHLFLPAGLAALVIAFLTVSFQSVKAALANPVDSLKRD
jgi:putative ABC transport system permease protein